MSDEPAYSPTPLDPRPPARDGKPLEPLITVRRLLAEVDLGAHAADEAIATGALKVFSVGRGRRGWRRTTRSEFERWLRACRVRPTAHAEDRVERVLAREGGAA